jgi:transcriptional regulator with XRE-family HTH domain
MEETILIQFGKQVRMLRQKQNISQEKLALIADLDRTYISGIERGKRNISLLNISKIADALHIELTTLFDFDKVENHE